MRTEEVGVAREATAAKIKELTTELSAKNMLVSVNLEIVEQLGVSITRAEANKQSIVNNNSSKIASLTQDIVTHTKLLSGFSFVSTEHTNKLIEANEATEVAETMKLKELSKKQVQANNKIIELHRLCSTKSAVLTTEKKQLLQSKHNVNTLGECPTCLFGIDDEHKTSTNEMLDTKIAELDTQLSKLVTNKAALLSKLQEKTTALGLEENLVQAILEQCEHNRTEFNADLLLASQQEAKRNTLQLQISNAEKEIEYLSNQSAVTYDNVIAQYQEEQTSAQENLDLHVLEQTAIEQELALYRYWLNAFSPTGIRSRMMDAITPFLNEKAEEYCQTLTKGEMSIRFDTKTAQKKKVVDKFNIDVSHKHGASSWNGSSTGEKARADLVFALLLGDLAALRSSKKLPFRFMDEPFENIDKAGTAAVMALLEDQKHKYESVYVITHKDSFKKLFPVEILLQKHNGFTTLEGIYERSCEDDGSN